jgi:hypothetical protein
MSKALRPEPHTTTPTALARARATCLITVLVLVIPCISGVLAINLFQDRSLIHATDQVTDGTLCAEWSATTGPGMGSGYSEFHTVAAVGPDDIWAIGSRGSTLPFIDFPISQRGSYAAHWDGTSWSLQDIAGDYYNDMFALSSNDIWAVGDSIAHWDGKSWSQVPDPAEGTYHDLGGVVALAPDDVWAVGYYNASPSGPLIMHWDGSEWNIDPGPPLTGTSDVDLYGVTAISDRDIWAVGAATTDTLPSDNKQPFAAHWDGAIWSTVDVPENQYGNVPTAVDAISTDDVWAVGYGGFIMHWDGTRWTLFDNPIRDSVAQHLNSVTAITPDNVWAFGGNSYSGGTIALHWDGTEWTDVGGINMGFHQNFYDSVQVSPDER